MIVDYSLEKLFRGFVFEEMWIKIISFQSLEKFEITVESHFF